MKKLFFILLIFEFTFGFSQFKVNVHINPTLSEQDAILFTFSGSKEIVFSKQSKKNNSWEFQFDQEYIGMMKLYLPNINYTFNLVSENKDIQVRLNSNSTSNVNEVIYLDQTNQLMESVLDIQKKGEFIYPALIQIKEYYNPKSDFAKALQLEIDRLNQKINIDSNQNPFVYYYHLNYNKFILQQNTVPKPSVSDYENFIYSTGSLLESSLLLRPILVNYLNSDSPANVERNIETFLKKLEVTSPRGQVVLSELIDIFEAYSMQTLKDKFLEQANSLKCTITPRLALTLKANNNTKVGHLFPNYNFKNVTNSKVKSLHEIKSSKKIIMFWSSTCSHCEKQLPILMKVYNQLKQKDIEVIGISLDLNKEDYLNKINALSWINDTELKGWNSSFVDTYNLHGTPSYFILDSQNLILAKPSHANDVLQFLNID